MAKKKKLTKAERKEARLRKGKQWLITYTGSPKKMNKHYRERFHVDAVTAAIGVRIPQCFFRMASGKCCSYMSIEFAVRQIISGKDTITADFFHADNEIHLISAISMHCTQPVLKSSQLVTEPSAGLEQEFFLTKQSMMLIFS